METGNPKQVAILCVMAVGALGFLATRLGGKAVTTSAAVAAKDASTQKATGLPSDLPISVDAFSHPKLAPPKQRVIPVALAASPMSGGAIASDNVSPLPFVGELPDDAIVRPVVRTPKAKKPPVVLLKPEPVDVALEATAGSSDAVAFLSIAGADSQPFRANDQIKGKVRLLRIEDGSVVLSGPTGELTISVGERKRI